MIHLDHNATTSRRRQRIVVAISGGVDSAMAAALLGEAGYDVVGVAMRLWDSEAGGNESGQRPLDEFLDARLVAERLQIPFYVMDFRPQFRRAVVDHFVAEYRRGRTPNPCSRCNQFIKFGSFWDRARELGGDLIATGHYARLQFGRRGVELRRGVDAQKDQSYFLFSVDPAVLRYTRLPLGTLTKAEVRREAARRRLPVAKKPDSQEVCFAPRGQYAAFVERQASAVPLRVGAILDPGGRVLARHAGVHRFTIGQRRRLGVGLGGPPRYVTEIDASTGVVRVGASEGVMSAGLVATGVNWLGAPPRPGEALTVKIRSRFGAQPARVVDVGVDHFSIVAENSLRAVAPGQAAVLYDGDRVIGGGWITCGLGRGAEVASNEAERSEARPVWK